ncbi:enoyl-CoA hydratase [Albimonas sp. CAU 1670]|uniref:enoyl-CoA hydratase n=1 Tax=Albimonas sp. CAU 1670 TaxID=3032599 RepID=UPI0023DCA31E|nr:enoyl-CoA hydratase [Albimonas sp. CAU 1670]MDF2234090.1 enoyl-CoA hydratase [Albimonas sp. CAU 1670]
MTYETLRVETPAEGVARITLSRVEMRNAQNETLLYELNAAFDAAAHDPAVKVIVLAGDGPHFSSGHDLRGARDMTQFTPVTAWGGVAAEEKGVAGRQAREEEIYLGFCRRWRDLPKPTIAQVQGKAIAGGLMLVAVCDLVVASEDAQFSDPTVAFGVNGVEWFSHPWDFGIRKAKEMLFTGAAFSAAEAERMGFVNKVVARDALEAETLALASRIAQRPAFGLRLAKQAMNQAQDAQGFQTAQNAAMSLHLMGHAHNEIVHGMLVDPAGAEIIRREAKAK